MPHYTTKHTNKPIINKKKKSKKKTPKTPD